MPTTDEAVRQFLKQFNNDQEAAINAIRSARTTKNSKPQSTPDTPVIIEATNLAKSYKVGHQKIAALNGVSLQIHQGEFVAITGSSGSGKSTLMQLLGGLEKPSSGDVIVDGTNLSSLSDGKLSEFRGQTIGFVFQFFYLQPFLNLQRNLEVPGMFAHAKRQDRQNRIQELAEIVGITDRLKHLPKELSGGQIQRAATVRALMNNPKILLADEPTGNLDSKNGAAIIELFENIRKEFGTTIIVATHDYTVAQRANRVLTLKDGVLV